MSNLVLPRVPARFRVREPMAPMAARRGLVNPLGFVETPDGPRAVFPISGATSPTGGYSTQGDAADLAARVTQTNDGVDINAIWVEMQQVLQLYNEQQSRIVSLLSYGTTERVVYVPQSTSGARFEEASEYGEPVAARPPADFVPLGVPYNDYDVAARYTWKFLRDADSRHVEAVHGHIMQGDHEHVVQRVLRRILDNSVGTSAHVLGGNVGDVVTVYPLWNGDTMVPPPHMGKVHTAPHTHYIASDGPMNGLDIEGLITHVRHHGYGIDGRGQLLILANPVEGTAMHGFRSAANGGPAGASYDFIPNQGAPAYLQVENLVGEPAPDSFHGLKISGSLGPAWLHETEFIPQGYVIVLAADAPNSPNNPVAIREHRNPAYRGLRLIAGTQQRYPLVDSFYSRGFGVGIRHRGAAAVLQVTAAADTTYEAPAATAFPAVP